MYFCNYCGADTVICQGCGTILCSANCSKRASAVVTWVEGVGNLCAACKHKRGVQDAMRKAHQPTSMASVNKAAEAKCHHCGRMLTEGEHWFCKQCSGSDGPAYT